MILNKSTYITQLDKETESKFDRISTKELSVMNMQNVPGLHIEKNNIQAKAADWIY